MASSNRVAIGIDPWFQNHASCYAHVSWQEQDCWDQRKDRIAPLSDCVPGVLFLEL